MFTEFKIIPDPTESSLKNQLFEKQKTVIKNKLNISYLWYMDYNVLIDNQSVAIIMNIFLLQTQNSNNLRSDELFNLNYYVKAKSMQDAQVYFLKHLFKDEFQNVDSTTLDKFEVISSYSDQFHELACSINKPQEGFIDPKDFGFDNISIDEVPDLHKAKITVHEPNGNTRKMRISGKVVIMHKIQIVSKRSLKALKAIPITKAA